MIGTAVERARERQEQPSLFSWLGVPGVRAGKARVSSRATTIRSSRCESGLLAVFNICRDWLEERGYAIQPTQAHKQVWDAFKQAAQADDASAPELAPRRRSMGPRSGHCGTEADYDDRVNQLSGRLAGRARDGGAAPADPAGAANEIGRLSAIECRRYARWISQPR